MSRKIRVITALLFIVPRLAGATDIVPQGSTSTSVNTNDSGRVDIHLALPERDVSYNAFSRFDVDTRGAAYINEGVNARTIVTEVFSASPSRIEGPLSVIGPRANLVFANQNGITVNGGRFINFGNVALTTGALSFKDVDENGIPRRYINADTHQGAIEIGSGGLVATLIRLELIAKQITVNGTLDNDWASDTGGVRMVAGASSALFDTAVSPTDNLTPWAYYAASKETSNDIALNIAVEGRVSSGRIDIVITDQGAGMRNSGTLLATAGDFTLSGTGDIIQQGTIDVARNAIIETNALHQLGHNASLSSSGYIDISAKEDIENQGTLQAAGYLLTGDDNDQAIAIRTGGHFENRGVQGTGAITFAYAGNMLIQAGKNIRNANGRIISNEALTLEAKGSVINESIHIPGDGESQWDQRNRTWFGLPRHNQGYTIDYGTLENLDALAYLVAGKDLSITASNIENRGGNINVNDGSFNVHAERTFSNESIATGSVTYSRKCNFLFCRRQAKTNVTLIGGQINISEDINITASERIDNIGGAILALQNIMLDAPFVLAQSKPNYLAINRDRGVKDFFGDSWGRVYTMDQGGQFEAIEGVISLTGEGSINGGVILAKEVLGNISVVRPPQRETATLDNHLGITSWWWR